MVGVESTALALPLELQAVRLFVRTGTLAAAARELGLPLADVRRWSQSIWWQTEVAALQRESSALADAMLTRIFDTGMDALLDRLTLGDVRMFGGKQVRVPVKAEVLAHIIDVAFTKRQLLRNEPTAIAGDTKRLNTLAQKLRALGAQDVTILEEADYGPAQES
jgi:hypothetical protein